MKIKYFSLPILFLLVLPLLFFYKSFFHGQISFPGDLLISEYNPWKAYSYFGYVPATFPSKLQYFDVAHQIYPWKTFVIDALKSGQIPLWNPYSFSGAPLLANIQSTVFAPLNTLYFIFSVPIAWTISILLQPLIASIGTYLFARKIGIQKAGSALSGLAYGYSLFMSVFLEYNTLGHVLAYLPFSLLAVEILVKKISRLSILIFVASIVFTLFAGHIQISAFNLIFICIYIFIRCINAKKPYLLILLGTLTSLSFGICSVLLLPVFELIKFSARVNQNYQFLIEKLLIQPSQTVLFFSPDFFGNPVTRNYVVQDSYPGNALYIGLFSIIFALSAFVLFKKNWHVRFFTISSIVLLLLFFRTPISEAFYKINIPFFSTGSPTNAIYLLSFSLSILAGWGLSNFEKTGTKKMLPIAAGILLFVLANAALMSTIVNRRNLIITLLGISLFIIILLGRQLLKIDKKYLLLFVILFTTADLFFYFIKFNPFVPKSLVYPDTPIFSYLKKTSGIDRFWGYGEASIDPNFSTQYKIFSPEGEDPLYPKWYGEFIQTADRGKLPEGFTNRTRSNASITAYGELDLPTNPYRLKVLDILGVKYVIDKKGSNTSLRTFEENRFKRVYEDSTWRVYENLQAAPRVFFAKKIDYYSTNDEFEKKFFDNQFDVKTTILLEKNSRSKNSPDITEGAVNTAKVITYSPNKILLETKSDQNGILFLSDTYYPGWTTNIDGKSGEILKANYAFRAIPVPKGEHIVELTYQPKTFYLGVKITIISLAALVGLIIFSNKLFAVRTENEK